MSFIAQKKVRQSLKKIILVGGGLYLILGLSLYMLQEKILFRPISLAADYSFNFKHPFEEVNLEANDGAILNAVHFKVENPKGVILYFHGNVGNIQRWGKMMPFFIEKDYDLLLMDYRTYGKSTGKLSEAALNRDAEMFYAHLKKQYKEDDIIVYGRSLGTGLASFVASKHAPKQLILETPYYSIIDVAKSRFPIFPIKKLMQYNFPSYDYIKNISCPITIFHGTADRVVPFSSGQKLFEQASKDQSTFVTIENGGHNNLVQFKSYRDKITALLK